MRDCDLGFYTIREKAADRSLNSIVNVHFCAGAEASAVKALSKLELEDDFIKGWKLVRFQLINRVDRDGVKFLQVTGSPKELTFPL